MQKKHHLNSEAKNTGSVTSNNQLNKKICEVAYELYQKRNCVPGYDLTDWFEAEKIVKQKQCSDVK